MEQWAVERFVRELMRIARALFSELRPRPDKWPDLLHTFQSLLNNSPSWHHSNQASIMSFMGMNPTPPSKTFINFDPGSTVTVEDVAYELIMNPKTMDDNMQPQHPQISFPLL